MYVTFGSYRGFTVNNLSPIEAPNPRCCSDPGVLCPDCARLVLNGKGITVNVQQRNPDTRGFARFGLPDEYLDADGNAKPVQPNRGERTTRVEGTFAPFGLPGEYLEDL